MQILFKLYLFTFYAQVLFLPWQLFRLPDINKYLTCRQSAMSYSPYPAGVMVTDKVEVGTPKLIHVCILLLDGKY
jgi:hypothetical protein